MNYNTPKIFKIFVECLPSFPYSIFVFSFLFKYWSRQIVIVHWNSGGWMPLTVFSLILDNWGGLSASVVSRVASWQARMNSTSPNKLIDRQDCVNNFHGINYFSWCWKLQGFHIWAHLGGHKYNEKSCPLTMFMQGWKIAFIGHAVIVDHESWFEHEYPKTTETVVSVHVKRFTTTPYSVWDNWMKIQRRWQ